MDSNSGLYPKPQKCPHPENCLGGKVDAQNGMFGACLQGYAHHLCSSCVDGYYMLTQRCIQCPNYHALYLVAAPLFALFLCCVLLFWLQTLCKL